MSKRKAEDDKKKSKKSKVETESPENEESHVIKQKEVITWPNADVLELIQNIKKKIPANDSVSYGCRLEKIDWRDVAFKTYSVKECQEVWSILLKQVRKFRLLEEVVDDMKTLVESPKQSSNKSVIKHPDKPKQPLNSYMLFVQKKRHEIMNEEPDLTPTDVSRKLGTMFKNLPIKSKEKYEKKARAAREEYVENLKTFYKDHPDQIPQKRSNSKALQLDDDSGPPKKPKTPFQLFVAVESEKEGEDNQQHNYREMWNEKTDDEKVFWINWALEQYNEYTKRLKEYLKIHPEYEPGPIKVLSKREQEIRDTHLGKPEKPPHSAYHLFTKMIMEADDMRRMNHKEAMTYISDKWKAMPEEEKNEYKVRFEQMWEEYNRRLEEYKMSLPPEERHKVKEVNVKKVTDTKKKSKAVKKVEKVKLPEPARPPLSEYQYFLSIYRGKENPSVVWDNMTADEKQEYEQQLAELQKDYVKRYEEYLKSLTKEELEELSTHRREVDDSSDSESDST